ncbi:MAG: sigma-70 family RNA polymerase sigma factor [Planctomycetota bacterium]
MQQQPTQFPDTRASLLVQLRSKDDERAWQEFVTIYRPVIYRIARARGLQDSDAQDLAQTVLVSVAGAIDSWEPREETRFRNWLRKVASNAILKALTRRPKDQAAGGSAAENIFDGQAITEEQLERDMQFESDREIYHRAARLVQAEIASDTWLVFQLAVVEGIPIEQVASQVGKSVGAAYAARGRVMKRLQAAVERLQKGGE